jgi:RNA polymerase sigma factor (sigma-70 family)
MTDNQTLLAEYTRNGSDAAFRELVTRYVDLVFSTALRLVGGDAHRAEDVVQTVFGDLARLARTLPADVKLGGWLHRDTYFVATTLMRGERRRQSRERQAVEMNALQNHSEADFSQVAPLLDEAINELGEADRTAILLRFFEQQDFRAVGLALGSNEDAARMRVTRALEKLEGFLKRRGVTTSAASLGVVLTANAVQAAPVGLAVTISTAAALAGTTLATTATATTIKAIAMTATQKLLVATIIVVSVLTPALVQHNAQTQLAEQDRALRQQAGRLAELQKENERLAHLMAEANSSRSLPYEQFHELLRLRSQVGLLNRDAQELTQLRTANSLTESNGLAATARLWSERANQLKQWLETNPDGKIPELQFLTDQDWIEAVHPLTLSSDEEYRRAMSTARANAELRVLDILHGALRQYGQANNGQFPQELSQLSPFVRSPVDDSILNRYEIVRADSLVSELQRGDDWVITQKAPVDKVWDARLTIGITYGGMADCRVTNRWVEAH